MKTQWTLLVMCIVILSGCNRSNQSQSNFILGQSTPLPINRISLEEIKPYFPAFVACSSSHPYNPVVLPFAGGPTQHDIYKGYAFSFLLSNALDWGPDCYCSKHAYFIFKRSEKEILDAGVAPTPAKIKSIAHRWQATHVLGGEIHAKGDGYDGTLQIFQANGELLYTQVYEPGGNYYNLLGNMSADALRFLGSPPSPALEAHLRRPRCKQDLLLVKLGEAAFCPERSREEFGIYKDILEQDPDFAEVRWWRANQFAWAIDAWNGYDKEMLACSRSYLTRVPLYFLDLTEQEDRDPQWGYGGLSHTIESYVASDDPILWDLRLKAFRIRRFAYTSELTEHALNSVRHYPLNTYLLQTIINNQEQQLDSGPLREDFSMMGSLAVELLKNPNLPNPSIAQWAQFYLACASRRLGYNQIAAPAFMALFNRALAQNNVQSIHLNGSYLIDCLQDMGRFSDCFDISRQIVEAAGPEANEETLIAGLNCGLMAGRTNEVESLYRSHEAALHAHLPEREALYFAYKAFEEGDTKTASDYFVKHPISLSALEFHSDIQPFILAAELDFKSNTTIYRLLIREAHCRFPAMRTLWILQDAYDRRDPRPDEDGFYEALAWLHGSDPWVKKAIADRKQRMPQGHSPDLQQILSCLDSYPPPAWPVQGYTIMGGQSREPNFVDPPRWDFTGAIHRMVEMREYERADEFARQCIAAGFAHKELKTHFQHLYYLVQAERAKKPATISRSLPPVSQNLFAPRMEISVGVE